jgi:hypothetical protein
MFIDERGQTELGADIVEAVPVGNQNPSILMVGVA